MFQVLRIAVFCSESIEYFPGTASNFFLLLLLLLLNTDIQENTLILVTALRHKYLISQKYLLFVTSANSSI